MRTTTRLPSTYSCYTHTLSNINETETLTAVYGNHMSGKTNNDVGYFHLTSVPSLTYFPKGIENFFPNLVAIAIYICNISTLNGDELDAFNKLTWFAFAGHPKLERIPGNLFTKTPLVHTVTLHNNNIKHVGENLFSTIPQLGYVHIINNFCVNQSAYTSSELSSLISHLRSKCPSCPNMNELICILNDQNQVLMQQNKEMDAKIDKMSKSINDLVDKNAILSQENSQIKKMLNEVLERITELSTLVVKT